MTRVLETKSTRTTKVMIAEAFKRVVCIHGFEKVTISSIVEGCLMSRQTFYNHFRDKYDLTLWIYGALMASTTMQINGAYTWEQAVTDKFEIMNANRCFYREIFRDMSDDGLRNNEPRLVFNGYKKNLARLAHRSLNSREQCQLMIYCYGATRMTIDWIYTDQSDLSISDIVEADKAALPSFVRSVFFETQSAE